MNCLSNDTNWANDAGWNTTHTISDAERISMEPIAIDQLRKRYARRELIISGSALTALIYLVLALLQT
jgi:hypothetical protein